MPNKFIYINNKKYDFQDGESVLEVSIRHKLDIPHFCYHQDLPVGANCRICLVKDEASGQIVTSCTLKAKTGLRVNTSNKKLKILRQKNLELLLAGHEKICPRCQAGDHCQAREIIKKYNIDTQKYGHDKVKAENFQPLQLGLAAEIDNNACINCDNCVKICHKIGIDFLQTKGKGVNRHIAFNPDPKVDCVYCGQCTAHCPVAAVREQSHLEDVEKLLRTKTVRAENLQPLPQSPPILIAQMAPSVRVSIGEEFGLEPGVNLSGQMYTAFRKLGFDYVFDVNMGADITTLVEAEELVERIKNKNTVRAENFQPLPMFTSCCPAWVKFIEFYYPEMIPHLTTARSPQIHSGGAYKSWWAEHQGLDPAQIKIISFMPCTSKKYESRHEKLKAKGQWPVDHVLTTRETANLLRRHQIDLPNLEPSQVDPVGEFSGAGAIYGASGGVMESALRTAAFLLNGQDLPQIEFKQVRGIEGIKKAKIKLGSQELSVAVVSTPKNAHLILQEIKANPLKYDYIEFMACPGGCIGGGGQPIPNTLAIVKERINGLYAIDKNKKIRHAHHNQIALDFVKFAKQKHQEASLLHTQYSKKNKFS